MRHFIAFAFVFTCLLALAPACDKTNPTTNYLDQANCTGVDAAENSYDNSIKAILDNACATSGCHDAAFPNGGVDLSSYAAAKNAFENSTCLCAIHHGSECNPMPQGGAKLSDAIIQKIDCWAKNGYAQ